MNRVIIMGRLGKDPEVRNFEGGGKIANVTVATDESYKDREGNKIQQTEWHNVVFRGKTAEIVEKYLVKGSQALIEGKLRTRSWDDKDGNRRYTTEVLADRFEFVGSKQQDQGQPVQQATQAQASSATPSTGWTPPATHPQIDQNDLPF